MIFKKSSSFCINRVLKVTARYHSKALVAPFESFDFCLSFRKSICFYVRSKVSSIQVKYPTHKKKWSAIETSSILPRKCWAKMLILLIDKKYNFSQRYSTKIWYFSYKNNIWYYKDIGNMLLNQSMEIRLNGKVFSPGWNISLI